MSLHDWGLDWRLDSSAPALRRLARGLLHEREGAEDLVQEAWLAALEKRPDPAFRGAWLYTTLRNAGLGVLRSDARRREREQRSARPEAQPSAAEVSGRIEILRRVLAALDALAEPYRTAVGLRYLEDLPPRTIAKRLGVPVNTARTQVRRGLEQLRRALDGGSARDRDELLAVLAPLAAHPLWLFPRPLLAAGGVLVVSAVAVWAVLRSPATSPASAGTTAVSERFAEPQRLGEEAAQAERVARDRAPGSGRSAMTAEFAIRGHVSRGTEPPLEGLTVRARMFAGYELSGELLQEATLSTDAAGNFSWAVEAPEEPVHVSLTCVDGEHISVEEQPFLAPGDEALEPIVLRALPLDALLGGTIRNPGGTPGAGAEVALGLEQRAVCDAQGRYRLRVASQKEEPTLSVLQPGVGATSLALGPFHPGETRTLDVELGPELVLRGIVREETGAPLPGATVESLIHRMQGVPWSTATTDDQGRYELRLEAVEWINLRVSAAGHVRVERSGTLPQEGQDTTFPDSEQLDPEHVDFTLAVGVPLHGVVHTVSGEPVAGALVSAQAGSATASGSDGSFTVASVGRGKGQLLVLHRGFASVRVPIVVPDHGEPDAVEIALEPQTLLSGIVLDEDEHPIPWAALMTGRATGAADGEGRFALGSLGAGARRLYVEAPGYADASFELDSTRTDLVLHLAPSACLRGHVLDAASGAPIQSFRIRVFSPTEPGRQVEGLSSFRDGVTFSDPDGAWQIEEAFPAGIELGIEASAPGHASAQRMNVLTQLPAEAEDLVLTLSGSTLVRGRVVDRDTGEGLAEVRLTRATGSRNAISGEDVLAHVRTDSDGYFALRNVPGGPMYLAVESFHHEGRVDGPFVVEGSAPIERLIALGHGASVVGRLEGPGGTGLAGEQVRLRGLDAIGRDFNWRFQTDQAGHFQFLNLASGSYHLDWLRRLESDASNWDSSMVVRVNGGGRPEQVFFKEASDLSLPIELASEEHLELVLRPRGRAELHGTLGFAGALPAAVSISLVLLDEDGQPTERARGAFAAGADFVVPSLEPGRYALTAQCFLDRTTLARGSTTVEVPEEGQATVHIELERGPR